MPPTTGNTEEIIEKRDSSPVAMSCLIIAVLALFGAIALQLTEISSQKTKTLELIVDNQYAKMVDSQIKRIREDATDAVQASDDAVRQEYYDRVAKIIPEAWDDFDKEAVGAGDDDDDDDDDIVEDDPDAGDDDDDDDDFDPEVDGDDDDDDA